MKKLIILISVMLLLILPMAFAAESTVIFNITFDDANDLFGNTCTVAGGTLSCGNGQVAGIVHKLINLSTNSINHTIELRARYSENTAGHYAWWFHDQNSTTAGNPNWYTVGYISSVYVQCLDYPPTLDTTVTGNNAWHTFKFVHQLDHTLDFYLDGSYIGTDTLRSANVNASWFLFKADGSEAFEVDWIAHYNTSETEYPEPSDTTQTFTITAKDSYSSAALTSFNISIGNSSNTYNFSTNNGTIIVTNATIEKFNVTYNITFNGNDSLGVFFKSQYVINLTPSNSMYGNLSQSVIVINATDLLTNLGLSSFTVQTNYTSYQATNGYIIIPSKPTHQVVNISSTQYPKQTHTYDIAALQNLTLYINMSPIFQFYLRREADNSPFDIVATNSTVLNIFCPDETKIITFRNNTYNSTQENITMDCPFTYMKMDISYEDTSYFRTLVPTTMEQNVTWWLLDLNLDTGVQKIVELVDLTGDWTNGLMRVQRSIGTAAEDIIEQFFDVSTSVTLYLLKDAIYTLILRNNDGTVERQIGTLIADSAGTVTITYPNIPFYPLETILEDNISWSYTCPFSQCPPPYNTSDSILRLHYIDGTGETKSITWTIYNGSDTAKILQTFSSTSSDVTFSYQPVSFNQSYITDMFVQHNTLAFNITDRKTFGDFVGQSVEGFTEDEWEDITKFAAGIFVIIWGLLFSAYHSGLGLGSAFVWVLIFRAKGYLDINYVWLSLMGVAAVFAFIYEAMKKD